MYLCQIADTILDVGFFCPFTSWLGVNCRDCCERANPSKRLERLKKKKKKKKDQTSKDDMVKQAR